MRNLFRRFRSLDRKIQIAVISAIVVFCCILPYISTTLSPTSPDEEPTQESIENTSSRTPERIMEQLLRNTQHLILMNKLKLSESQL